MYGLPNRPLTYDEEVTLDLCMDRACRRLAKIAAEGVRVANGATPAPDWYVMDAESEDEGMRQYYEALLASRLRATRGGR